MKEKMKKVGERLVLLLCLLSCCCLLACRKNEEPDKTIDTPQKDIIENNETKKDLTESGYYLVEKGITDYRIVIPENATDMLKEASEELQSFLAQATGVTVEIATDTEVAGTDSIISLGKTKTAKALGVETTEADDLGTSDYLIKTVGSSIVIMDKVNGDGEGVLYGVYDFLEDAVGLIVYASDEIAYDSKDTVPLYVYDNIVKPSFDVRSLTYNDVRTDESYLHRMRLVDLYNWSKLGTWGHTQVSVILPNTGEHADWYSADGKQLCWSAGDAMEAAFANNLIKIIKEHPDAIYFMLGQEDVTNACDCEKCKANIAKDKYGSYAGLQIAFLNRIIEKVEAWRTQNAPERDIRYVCFAYYMTFAAPVKNDESGNMVAYHEDCKPSDKLYIFVASIGGDYASTLDDAINASTLQATKGWGALAPGRVMIYEYDCNFRNYLLNFNNFDVVQSHYKTYSENGVSLMYSQGPVTAKIPCFTEMRLYVESRLMWNLERNYDTLVNDFMSAYYKDAADAMREYYDYLREVYAEYKKNGGDGGIYASIEEAYTLDTVKEMDAYIEKALQAIEPLRNTNNELFATLYYRIKKESISNLWLKLNKFDLAYSEEELDHIALEFYYLCDKCGIEYYAEGQAIGSKFYQFFME